MTYWYEEAQWFSLSIDPDRECWRLAPWGAPPPIDGLRLFELSLTEADLEDLLLEVHRANGYPVAARSESLQMGADFIARFRDGSGVGIEVKDEDPLSNALSTTRDPETKARQRPSEQLARYATSGVPNVVHWALAAPGFTRDLFNAVAESTPSATLLAVRTFEHQGRLGLAVLPRRATDPPPSYSWPIADLANQESEWSLHRSAFLQAVCDHWVTPPEGYGPARLWQTKSALKPPARGLRSSRGVTVQRDHVPVTVRGTKRQIQERVTLTIEPSFEKAPGRFRAELRYMALAYQRQKFMKALGFRNAPSAVELSALYDRLRTFVAPDVASRIVYDKQEFHIRIFKTQEIAAEDISQPPAKLIPDLLAALDALRREAEPWVREFLSA
ncbi:MAG: hypothetical protein KC613_23845 [Myxococcales bacterium]|nr:hypothetical protein [Myxococcales bacterium]